MTDIETVRLLIGDTADPPHFTDAQIQAFLDLAGGNIYEAAALACNAWAGHLAGAMESEKIGDYSYARKQYDNLLRLAQEYRTKARMVPAFERATIIDHEL